MFKSEIFGNHNAEVNFEKVGRLNTSLTVFDSRIKTGRFNINIPLKIVTVHTRD